MSAATSTGFDANVIAPHQRGQSDQWDDPLDMALVAGLLPLMAWTG